MSLLLIGIRSPDHAGEPALRRGADPEAARAAAHGRAAWRPTTSATCGPSSRRTSGSTSRRTTSSRSAIACATRSASARTRSSSRSATSEPIDKMQKRIAAPRRPRRALPGRRLQQQRRRVRLDRGAAARAASSSSTRARRSSTRPTSSSPSDPPVALPPADDGRGRRGRSPPAIANRQAVERRHRLGHHHLPGDRRRSRSGSTSGGCARSRSPGSRPPSAPPIAFAVAELAFGYLNSSTAFLGSIIVGNGINYAIVLMSRYEEQRARGAGSRRRRCERGARRASGAARWWRRSRASAAYASLMVTSFRGFYQFGVMGAVGSLACWLATFTVLPAMLVLLDRRAAGGAPRPARAAARVSARWRASSARRSGAGHRRLHGAGASSASSGCATSSRTRSSTTSASSPRSSNTTDEAQAVRPQRRRALRPLAVADHRARRQRRRGRADQGGDPQAGSATLPGPGRRSARS